jgi:ZIP family zinc transporter/zinc and cadmium transporter
MFLNVLIYSFLAGISTLFGILLVRRFESWVRKNVVFLISFAIGVLLANAFFHLLPESIKINSDWFYWTLGTIIFLYLIEHLMIIHTCREEKCEVHTLGKMSLIGLCFHSLIDGMVIGASFGASFILGALVSLAIIFHKTAEGVCAYTLLLQDHLLNKNAFLLSFLVVLATPLGAILTFLWIQNIRPEILGCLLSIAAGSFIYIGASDLVPETHKKYNFWNIFLVLLGIGFVLVISRIIG